MGEGGKDVVIKTGRFGQITVQPEEVITFAQGLLGFTQSKRFCLVDSGDDTLILWLQSIDEPELSFPILEPKIFRPDYTARLSATELKDLKLESINQSAVFTILTIPEDISTMTANLKAPIVINLREQIARQVVLQENDYSIKHPMFKDLRIHLMTIEAQRGSVRNTEGESGGLYRTVVAIKNIPPSLTVKSLHA